MEFGEPEKKMEHLAEVERIYDRMKEDVSRSKEEIEAIEEEFDSDFMRASRRAMAKSIEHAAPEPELPGIDSLRRLPEDPGEQWG